MGPLIRSIFWKVPTPGHGAATGQRKPVGGWGGTAISTKQATAETVALLNICGHVQPACPGSRCPDGMVKIGAPEISPKGPVQARLSAARAQLVTKPSAVAIFSSIFIFLPPIERASQRSTLT